MHVHKHPQQGRIVRAIERPSAAHIQFLAQAYSAFVLDRLGKYGAAHPDLKPLSSGMKVCGPATTVLGADLSVRRMAINLAQPGDVLVVAAGGGVDHACFGDGTAKRMKLKGIVGAVIDGATRDAAALREMGYPTFVRGVRPDNYHYPTAAEFGAINVPVVCAGVLVNPGDLIIGDDDGVVAVPRELVQSLVEIVSVELKEEKALRQRMTQFEPFDVEAELLARGYHYE